HASVTVLCDPADYATTLEKLAEGGEGLADFRRACALKVFQRTSAYDGAIAAYLETQAPSGGDVLGLPAQLALNIPRAQTLRYGENPHQQAALYGRFHECFEQLQGKELSYNNLIDITAATYLIGEFEKPTLAILKHTNPCGVASAMDLMTCWEQAFATDQQAPFGGIIVANRTIDTDLAKTIAGIFCEVIIAPEFTAEAREIFGKKKNLRLMIARDYLNADDLREVKSVIGGYLVQDRDYRASKEAEWQVVTERQPTSEEMAALRFGWKVVKHVKSNAIVYAGAERTLGIGAGQMSRVDSSNIAVWKAGEAKLPLADSVVCSDAFFPFADGLLAAADAGATAAIQPGGSVRDEEVVKAANERGMAMIFTGKRHFKH
ncbi:MAG: bifunctional phosphoribosylaminoimidazolecarboxamide formyltransferase/IMP cyclohydrolase, partial [Verrucomicrobiota bacterium]